MTESNKNVLFAIRTARVAYEHLYRVNPFAALEYSASLLPGVRRCVEACPAIEVSPDWPLADRLAEWRTIRDRVDPNRVFHSDLGRRLDLC